MMKLPKSRNENIVEQQLEGEILIYDLTISKAYCLNETSALVYQACDGKTTLDELESRQKLSKDLIFFALDQLRDLNLLNEDAKYVSPLAGISRREAVRRVGFASIAALPVVSVMLAPTSANAASAFAPRSRTLRQSCNTSADCAPSAPNCTETPQNSGQDICCIGDTSYYDTGGVVNSCSGGSCNAGTFACQSDAARFCCSGLTTITCSGNACQCRCV